MVSKVVHSLFIKRLSAVKISINRNLYNNAPTQKIVTKKNRQ